MVSKARRYKGNLDFYQKKLLKVMQDLGIGKASYQLKYDPWEGARLDFTYKSVTRRLEKLINNRTIHFGSDCLAQIALTMEKFLWMKREDIFDLDVAAAGLPQLPAPPTDYFVGITTEADLDARRKKLLLELHPDKNGGDNEPFKDLQEQYVERKQQLQGGR